METVERNLVTVDCITNRDIPVETKQAIIDYLTSKHGHEDRVAIVKQILSELSRFQNRYQFESYLHGTIRPALTQVWRVYLANDEDCEDMSQDFTDVYFKLIIAGMLEHFLDEAFSEIASKGDNFADRVASVTESDDPKTL
ncbi:hypothetical protein ACFLZH_03025 [Patescibacteria group bacterium]